MFLYSRHQPPTIYTGGIPDGCAECIDYHRSRHPHPHCVECDAFHNSMHSSKCDKCEEFHRNGHKTQLSPPDKDDKNLDKTTSVPTSQTSDSNEWSWENAKILPDGSYTGEWSNSRGRHGWGMMEYNPNVQEFDKYEGGWDENRHHGWGCMKYKSNNANHWSEYTGGWDENKKHGYGKMIYSDGSTYVGGWNNDERHGYAVYHYITTHGTNAIYRGCFKLDERYEGTVTGKNNSGVSLEYFGRFRENTFEDREAFVLIGGHPSHREYRGDNWIHHQKGGSKPNDELDCLKGERSR